MSGFVKKRERCLSARIIIREASDSVPQDRQGLTDGEEERRGKERRGQHWNGSQNKFVSQVTLEKCLNNLMNRRENLC